MSVEYSADQAADIALDQLAHRGPAWFMHRLDRKRTVAPHLELMSSRIAAGVEKGNYRGIFCCAPRHGKSSLISEGTSAWFLNRWPEKRIIECAYGDSFAASWGEKVRDLLSANASRLKVRLKRQDKGAVDEWDTTAGGGMKTAGVGTGILGRGADCCARGTLIGTPSGQRKIETLKIGDLVWSRSQKSGKIEAKSILATREKYSTNVVRISTSGHRNFICTDDHLVWGWHRYFPAASLRPGYKVAWFTSVGLPEMSGHKKRRFKNLSAVLFCNSGSENIHPE